jgi:hypothetical protein
MQIAACQPVSFRLEYTSVKTSTLSRVTPRISIPGSPFRAAGYSTAAQADVEWREQRIWSQFYLDYRATVLNLLPRHRQPATAAVATVIEVGNAPKADIERLGLKCREVPNGDIKPTSKAAGTA